jgi:hypothetical protein
MSAPKATEQQSQDAETGPARNQAPNLDRRYGKIGISAVAAAVRCWPQKQQQAAAGDSYQYESD